MAIYMNAKTKRDFDAKIFLYTIGDGRQIVSFREKAMMLSLHREQSLSDLFTAYLLVRNIRYQEDLIDQHCNSSEKRLARILLLLAKKQTPDSVVPKLDQTSLAQMVGTARSRISFFMNRFRSLGLIEYSDCRRGLQIHRSLLALYAGKNALTLAPS